MPSSFSIAKYLVPLLLTFSIAHAVEWIVEGQVVGVSDGDTITVLDDAKTLHKIRFVGIDAPEKGQAFGERSRQSLSDLVFRQAHDGSSGEPIEGVTQAVQAFKQEAAAAKVIF